MIGAISILGSVFWLKRKIEIKYLDNYFLNYITSVENENMKLFMSYQNIANNEFAKEQERWFVEVNNQRKKGFIFQPAVTSFKQIDKENGLLGLSLKITRPSGREKLIQGEYSLIKNRQQQWVINDFPMNELKGNEFILKYFSGNETEANVAAFSIEKVLHIYKNLFNWSPSELNIKLFSDLDSISITIPDFAIYGWSEANESLKVLVPEYVKDKGEFLKNLLAHELSHKMLSSLTQDNASLYIQEGLAIYLEKGLSNQNGEFWHDINNLQEHLAEVLEAENNEFLSITDLNKMDYDDGLKIYYQGFLLVFFLIENYGIQRFLKFISFLNQYSYVDSRIEYKLNTINDRTLMSLINIYGDEAEICSQLRGFYDSKKLNYSIN